MPFVLDASAAVAWAFSDMKSKAAVSALNEVQSSYAIVPALWPFEIASALRKAVKEARLSPVQRTEFLADLATLEIRIHPDSPAIEQLLDISERFGLSIYDAAYLLLALQTRQPLATLDDDLATAARSAGVFLFVAP